jgi:hypothetical protein
MLQPRASRFKTRLLGVRISIINGQPGSSAGLVSDFRMKLGAGFPYIRAGGYTVTPLPVGVRAAGLTGADVRERMIAVARDT